MVHERHATTPGSRPDSWHLLHGEYSGQPMLVRLNTAAVALAGRGTHDIRVGVAVPFNAPGADGLPEVVEGDELTAFEDFLVDITGNRGTLVAVVTAGGRREFVLYTGDERWIGQLQRDLADAISSHQVQVSAELDPTWNAFRSFQPWPPQRPRAL